MSKKIDQKNQRIQVFARCRPLNTFEKKHGSPSIVEVIAEKKEIVLRDRNASKEFFFDKVFPPDSKQISVYKSVVQPLIQEVLMGYNCTVFAYGQTGTGKTYTMEGERSDNLCSWEDDPGAGIIPRSLHQLFEELNQGENMEFSVRVSFLELYNEELFDLLGTADFARLRLFEDSARKGSVIIQGLSEVTVNSKDEVYSILEKGTSRRQTAATMLNATSSRSHTVFSVTVHLKENTIEGEELLKTGKLNLVDLAGSENVGRSGATEKRAREAGNINQSLLTLGRVITSLIEKQPHVPYRESKLTRLLQDSLGGHTKTSIIATISPALCNLDETISTLDYATKAKSITIRPVINQKMTKRALLREYTEEIQRLAKDLEAARGKEGFFIDTDNYAHMMKEISEKTDLIKDLIDKKELLEEENKKFEEELHLLKEDFCKKSELLVRTEKEKEAVENELSHTANTLCNTQRILTNTTLDRDHKAFEIGIRENTEKKLSETAEKLLNVADHTTDDINKLHSKLDRKLAVERTNEERSHSFRALYHQNFARLQDMVTSNNENQLMQMQTFKQQIDQLKSKCMECNSASTSGLQDMYTYQKTKFEQFSAHITKLFEDDTELANKYLHEFTARKNQFIQEQESYLKDKLPCAFNELTEGSTAMSDWFLSTHKDFSLKIESQKKSMNTRAETMLNLISSAQAENEDFYMHHETILAQLKSQTSSLIQTQNKLKQAAERTLSIVLESMNLSSQVDNSITQLATKAPQLHSIQSSLQSQKDLVKSTEIDLESLDRIAETFSVEDFSSKNNYVLGKQKSLEADITCFTEHNLQIIENNSKLTASAIEHYALSAPENSRLTNDLINDMSSSLSERIDVNKCLLGESCKNQQELFINSSNYIDISKKNAEQNTSIMNLEISEVDLHLEKFFTDELVKDVPTGATPVRQTYPYPKLLPATSPKENIMQKFRAHLSERAETAANTPLDSSFNKGSRGGKGWNVEAFDIPKLRSRSLSSDEYDSSESGTISATSSMSDISEFNRNKENLNNSKKMSRLPRKVRKKFLLPPTPKSRKPLLSQNME